MSGVRVPAPPPVATFTRRALARLRRVEPVLRRALRGPCRLPRGSRVLVAASGGADSTALLVGLSRIAPEFELEIAAAHLHHGLRGIEADGDLAQVRALCARLGVPLIAARWDARRRMRSRGLAGENGLRVLRREFLAAAVRRARAAAIATGHTADDQLETLLMRFVRGTGLEGLGAMAPRRGRWIKPLLGATRLDVTRDLERAGIAWREDRSNQDPRFLRNRIRHQVVPALVLASGRAGALGAAAGRALLARHALALTAEARSASRMLKRFAKRVRNAVCRIQEREFTLDSETVATYPLALRHSLFREIWRRTARPPCGLTRRHLEALDGLVEPGGTRSGIQLPGGILAWREGNRLFCSPRRPAARAGAARGAGR